MTFPIVNCKKYIKLTEVKGGISSVYLCIRLKGNLIGSFVIGENYRNSKIFPIVTLKYREIADLVVFDAHGFRIEAKPECFSFDFNEDNKHLTISLELDLKSFNQMVMSK